MPYSTLAASLAVQCFERRARKRQAVPAPENVGDHRRRPLRKWHASMFVLAVVRDAVRVSPAAFGKAPSDALRDEVDARYGGRVLSDVGFVVCCETAKTVSFTA